ncbi:1-deoxy-D-xylulose-5-phosphate synthase [Angustibacter sp. McL0619]|uniref:1-deoxy-D-xylulose-5-phosphate synthase n=1 Tax=Angustibacter sp. McL0619 TaxID=3415676 RepID=UPI003CF46C5A
MTARRPANIAGTAATAGATLSVRPVALTNLLESITGPEDVKRLDAHGVITLAEQIRSFLIDSVCRTGGHLGPNLGVVEVSIALHRVFDSPHDVILWDTGHQAYVHKLLTGRRASFDRLRQRDGLSGYPSRAESDHDVIENSHASTALSYADGLAKAFSLRGMAERAVVAVVGDGALTGGMCWEALNNIGGAPHRPVIVVVNDNGRSYDPTIGGLAVHLADLRDRAPGTSTEPSIFTDLGLAYVGPVDGHDEAAVESALRAARGLHRPVIVHCITRKGAGYPPAERHEADRMHAIAAGSPGAATAAPAQTWTDVFGQEIVRIAADRPDVVAITAAMLRPVGLGDFAAAFPDRVFDVGIAEQHAVTSAAGLALGGMHPVLAIYATFLNRAFDQALMDVALHRLGVTFVLDRAGITGDDGPSHNGMWDLSLLQLLPGVQIAAPRDAANLRRALREAVDVHDGPTVIRFPKSAVGPAVTEIASVGGVDVLSARPRPVVLIVSVGALAATCLALGDALARRGVAATVVDPRWVYPVNHALKDLAAAHEVVVTVEDNNTIGGVGAGIAQFLRQNGVDTPVREFGIPPRFQPTAKRADLLASLDLSADALAPRVMAELAGCLTSRQRPRGAIGQTRFPKARAASS